MLQTYFQMFSSELFFSFIDIDECRSPNICGRNAVCKNIIGNYRCECRHGYEKISSAPESHCRGMIWYFM